MNNPPEKSNLQMVQVRRKGEKRSVALKPGAEINIPLHRYVRIRHISQVTVLGAYLLMPLLNIMRIDTARGKMILFGQATPILWLAVILPLFLVVPGIIYMWLASRYGRFFCSSACMQGTMVELGNKLSLQLLGRLHLTAGKYERSTSHFRTQKTRWKVSDGFKRNLLRLEALLVLVGLPFIVSISSLAWFVDPARLWQEFANWDFEPTHAGTIITMTLIGVFSLLFVKERFCRYMCYVGILQQYAAQGKKLRGAGPTQDLNERCIHCNACVDVCYMNIDPRHRRTYIFDPCVSCGDCVVACEAELGRSRQDPVLQMPVIGGNPLPDVDYKALRSKSH